MRPPEMISCRAQFRARAKVKTLACLRPTLLQLRRPTTSTTTTTTTQSRVVSARFVMDSFSPVSFSQRRVEEHRFVDRENINFLKSELWFYFSAVLEKQKCWWFSCLCLWHPRTGTSPARRLLPATPWHPVTMSNPRSARPDTPSQRARASSTPVCIHFTNTAIRNGLVESWVIEYLGILLWYVRYHNKPAFKCEILGRFVYKGATRKVRLTKVRSDKNWSSF